MSVSTGVRRVSGFALLPWRATYGVLRAGAHGVLALPRRLGSAGGSSDATSSGAGLLAASADRSSAANHELHKTGEGAFPIPNYDVLTATDAAIAVQTLTSKTDVQAAMRHERAGKNRKTVADAGQRRLAELSG